MHRGQYWPLLESTRAFGIPTSLTLETLIQGWSKRLRRRPKLFICGDGKGTARQMLAIEGVWLAFPLPKAAGLLSRLCL